MPRTVEQHERSLHQTAFCELLPVRDIMHDVIIRTTGAFVAGYELSGINSYYHSDEGRNGTARRRPATTLNPGPRTLDPEPLAPASSRLSACFRSDQGVDLAILRILSRPVHRARSSRQFQSVPGGSEPSPIPDPLRSLLTQPFPSDWSAPQPYRARTAGHPCAVCS